MNLISPVPGQVFQLFGLLQSQHQCHLYIKLSTKIWTARSRLLRYILSENLHKTCQRQ